MKNKLLLNSRFLFLLTFLLFACSQKNDKSNQSITFSFIDHDGKADTPDKKLTDSWIAFVKAVKEQDFELLKDLSAECIICPNCLNNTPSEDSALTKAMLNDSLENSDGENQRGIDSFEEFLINDYKICFTSNLISRMSDSTKVQGHYDHSNGYLFSKVCIPLNIKIQKPRFVEFFITDIDPTEDFEGGASALGFIETSDGYKFCSYSTIP